MINFKTARLLILLFLFSKNYNLISLDIITNSEILIKSRKIKSSNLKMEKALFAKKIKLCAGLSISFVGIYFFLNHKDNYEINDDEIFQIKLDCLREARDKYSIKSLIKKGLLAFFIIPLISKTFSSIEELVKKNLFSKISDNERNLLQIHESLVKTSIILKEFLKLIELKIIDDHVDFLVILNQFRKNLILASATNLLLLAKTPKAYIQQSLIKKLVFLFNQIATKQEALELTINNFSQLLKTCEALQKILIDQ